MKINLKQFHNAINKAVEKFFKNKHKILCSLGFHKAIRNQPYELHKMIICQYCRKELK
jgi:hypothetical protein